MRIVLNDCEREALAVVSFEALRLYVLLLRPLMDIQTGLVGVTHKVSRGRLALDMAWQPPRGSHRPAYSPTIKQVRGLIGELEAAGLARNYSSSGKEEKSLVLKLLMAECAQSRLREEGPMKGREHGPYDGQQQSGVIAGFAPNDGQYEGPMKGGEDGPISEYRRENPLFMDSAVVTGSSIGAENEIRPALLDRAVEVAKLLREAGIDATPAQLRASNAAAALLQADADWLAAAEKARHQKPTQRIGVNYLLPIMRDFAAGVGGVQKRAGKVSTIDHNRASAEEAMRRLKVANGG